MTVLKFAKLTEKAFVPTKGSKYAAGYDLRRYVFEIFRLDKIAVSGIFFRYYFLFLTVLMNILCRQMVKNLSKLIYKLKFLKIHMGE